MRIKEITSRHRNDFRAILECEHCESEQELKSGYEDSYYHTKVLPAIECVGCGKARIAKGESAETDNKPKGE